MNRFDIIREAYFTSTDPKRTARAFDLMEKLMQRRLHPNRSETQKRMAAYQRDFEAGKTLRCDGGDLFKPDSYQMPHAGTYPMADTTKYAMKARESVGDKLKGDPNVIVVFTSGKPVGDGPATFDGDLALLRAEWEKK